MAIKLKEITIKPQNPYMAEFFESVAAEPEGKYFKYERPTTNTLLRSGAQTFGAKLGKKFSIHQLAEGETVSFAVGWTTKERKARTRKEKAAEPVQTSPDPVISEELS